MIRIAFAAALILAAPAWATDARIATRFYDAGTIVRLSGRPGWQSTIEFAPDEKVENVAVGDSSGWQVTPNKRANLLFVKPMAARAKTNMTVVTDQRTYLFDLATTATDPIYVLRFTYPRTAPSAGSEPAKASTPAPSPQLAPATSIAVAESPVSPATLHFNWASQGDRRLLPARTYDDGHQTFLAWGKDVAMPAILMPGPDGVEGPVNYSVKGDTVVIDGVPAKLVLRSGKAFATLSAPPVAVASSEKPSQIAER
jgi:type IV secretion system protein VirB9